MDNNKSSTAGGVVSGPLNAKAAAKDAIPGKEVLREFLDEVYGKPEAWEDEWLGLKSKKGY